MDRVARRKVYVVVDPDTWQAFRVKCMQAGVAVQDAVGSYVYGVASGALGPIAGQLELEVAPKPAKPAAARRKRRSTVRGGTVAVEGADQHDAAIAKANTRSGATKKVRPTRRRKS